MSHHEKNYTNLSKCCRSFTCYMGVGQSWKEHSNVVLYWNKKNTNNDAAIFRFLSLCWLNQQSSLHLQNSWQQLYKLCLHVCQTLKGRGKGSQEKCHNLISILESLLVILSLIRKPGVIGKDNFYFSHHYLPLLSVEF